MTTGRPPARRLSTATRLSLVVLAVLLAVWAVSVFATWSVLRARTDRDAGVALAAEVAAYQAALRHAGAGTFQASTVSYLATEVLPAGELVVVAVGPSHLYGSAGADVALLSSEVRALIATTTVTRTGTTELASSPTAYAVVPIDYSGRRAGVLVVLKDLAAARAADWAVVRLTIVLGLVALAAAVAATYLVLRRVLRTVGTMTASARRIERGALGERLGDPGTGDEVAELAATFDTLLDRLGEVLDSQRRLLSDVSHQLRTPLTVARGHLEVLNRHGADDPTEVRSTVSTVVQELTHMGQLTERLLLLGHAMEPDFLDLVPVDVVDFVADLGAAAEVLGFERVEVAAAPEVVAVLDRAKVRGAILNLIDNAAKATQTNGVVALRATLEGSWLRIEVADDGPGIAPDQLDQVLGRFGRPDDTDRPGTGLGLAIVAAVAEAHGGTFEVRRADLGGCSATMVLPIDGPPR